MHAPFERVVHDYGLNVLRVCRSLLDEHRAQDAWSETFLAALKAYPQLPEDANVLAWLVTIAHRKAIDELRRDRHLGNGDTPPERPAPAAQQPEERWERHELWQAVKALPTKQRQVLAYRYLGGLSYADIATILSGTEAAARRAGADGLKNLRAAGIENPYLQEQP